MGISLYRRRVETPFTQACARRRRMELDFTIRDNPLTLHASPRPRRARQGREISHSPPSATVLSFASQHRRLLPLCRAATAVRRNNDFRVSLLHASTDLSRPPRPQALHYAALSSFVLAAPPRACRPTRDPDFANAATILNCLSVYLPHTQYMTFGRLYPLRSSLGRCEARTQLRSTIYSCIRTPRCGKVVTYGVRAHKAVPTRAERPALRGTCLSLSLCRPPCTWAWIRLGVDGHAPVITRLPNPRTGSFFFLDLWWPMIG